MRVEDIDIVAYSPDDGFMDPHSVLMGFRRKATSLGIHYRKDRGRRFRHRWQARRRRSARTRGAASRRQRGQRRQLLEPGALRQGGDAGPGLSDAPSFTRYTEAELTQNSRSLDGFCQVYGGLRDLGRLVSPGQRRGYLEADPYRVHEAIWNAGSGSDRDRLARGSLGRVRWSVHKFG